MPTLKLTKGELLLLDWVLTHPIQMPEPNLQWYMEWDEVRQSVWNCIRILEAKKDMNEVELRLNELDIRILLALVPTTFRWGVGDDVGYSLKLKLSKALNPYLEAMLEEVEDAGEERSDAADHGAKDVAGSQA